MTCSRMRSHRAGSRMIEFTYAISKDFTRDTLRLSYSEQRRLTCLRNEVCLHDYALFVLV